MTTETGLSVNEKNALVMYERIIEGGLVTFQEVGGALAEVRDRKLYRESHGTFEEYCVERWDMSARRAYQYIEAASTTKNFSERTPAPAVESQAAELARVPKEHREAVWERTVEETSGKPTARAVAEAWEEVQDEQPEVEVISTESELDKRIRLTHELFAAGKTVTEISKELNVSRPTVHRDLKRENPREVPEADTSPSDEEEVLEGVPVPRPTKPKKLSELDQFLLKVPDSIFAFQESWDRIKDSEQEVSLSDDMLMEINATLDRKIRRKLVFEIHERVKEIRKNRK